MSRLIRFIWLLSILAFLIVFLFQYASLPAEVALKLQQQIEDVPVFSRSAFFYIGLAVFLLINIIFYVFIGLIKRLPDTEVKNETWLFNDKLRPMLLDWVRSFNALLNGFLIILVIVIGSYNDPAYNNPSLVYLVYFGALLIFVWIIVLLLKLLRGR